MHLFRSIVSTGFLCTAFYDAHAGPAFPEFVGGGAARLRLDLATDSLSQPLFFNLEGTDSP